MSIADASEAGRRSGYSVYTRSIGLAGDPFTRKLHLAVGMFDGVHLGHQAVLGQAMEAARGDSGSSSAVLTFDPHPSKVLRPDTAAKMLMALDDRISQMLSLGIDIVFVKTFTPEMAQTRAEAFVPGLKDVFPLLSSLHVGANFRFGVGRSGSVDTLMEDARKAGLTAHILKGRVQGGEVISSSRIRQELEAGNIEQVNELLGYPYHVSGTITPGRQIGRQIGFPTLNINWLPESRPRYCVYKSWLLTADGSAPLPGVANYGRNPTVGYSG